MRQSNREENNFNKVIKLIKTYKDSFTKVKLFLKTSQSSIMHYRFDRESQKIKDWGDKFGALFAD